VSEPGAVGPLAEAPPAPPPSLAEALAWIGFELDDSVGRGVGRVTAVYADAEGGAPVWLVVALESGRRRLSFARRRAKAVIVPLRECAAMPGRVWTAQGREAIRAAPAVDPSRPLLREHEAAICLHYGIGEAVGRHAEVAGRADASVTAQPA
jgi:hypothetical protein